MAPPCFISTFAIVNRRYDNWRREKVEGEKSKWRGRERWSLAAFPLAEVKLGGWNVNRVDLLLRPFSRSVSTYGDRAGCM